MNIRFKNVSKELQLLTKKAVQFYESNFMPAKHEKMDLTIEFDMTMFHLGMTDHSDSDVFHIYVNPFFPVVSEYLNTLFHELTHVKQMMEGRLTQIHGGIVFEKKTFYLSPFKSNSIEDLCSPWEIEAYGYGEAALLLFCNRMMDVDTELASAFLEKGNESTVLANTEWGRLESKTRLSALQKFAQTNR